MPLSRELSHKHWCCSPHKYTQTVTKTGLDTIMAKYGGQVLMEGGPASILYVQTGLHSFQIWVEDPECPQDHKLSTGTPPEAQPGPDLTA